MVNESFFSSNFPHCPPHWHREKGVYIVTCSTYKKIHIFQTYDLLSMLNEVMLRLALEYGWNMQAWAVFSNHLHFVADTNNPESLPMFIRRMHSVTAMKANKMQNMTGRKVWRQYWDSLITYDTSWLARLNYVNMNPVKHGLVNHAENYPFCSAGWLKQTGQTELIKTLKTFDYNQVEIEDDF